jgi:hypothetical protein
MDYKKNHFIHESMIYGYDDSTGGFYAVLLDKARNFTSAFIPYSEAVNGIKEAYLQTSECFYQAYLHLLKPIPARVSFDYPNVQLQINNYLKSTTALVDTYHLSLYDHMAGDTPASYKFGTSVYDELAAAYSAIDPDWVLTWVTYMNFHLLTEHKQHILKTLHHVNTTVLEKPVLSTLLESYSLVVNEHELLRIRQLKFFLKVSKSPPTVPLSFDETIAKLRELKDRELAILTKIMSLLS